MSKKSKNEGSRPKIANFQRNSWIFSTIFVLICTDLYIIILIYTFLYLFVQKLFKSIIQLGTMLTTNIAIMKKAIDMKMNFVSNLLFLIRENPQHISTINEGIQIFKYTAYFNSLEYQNKIPVLSNKEQIKIIFKKISEVIGVQYRRSGENRNLEKFSEIITQLNKMLPEIDQDNTTLKNNDHKKLSTVQKPKNDINARIKQTEKPEVETVVHDSLLESERRMTKANVVVDLEKEMEENNIHHQFLDDFLNINYGVKIKVCLYMKYHLMKDLQKYIEVKELIDEKSSKFTRDSAVLKNIFKLYGFSEVVNSGMSMMDSTRLVNELKLRQYNDLPEFQIEREDPFPDFIKGIDEERRRTNYIVDPQEFSGEL